MLSVEKNVYFNPQIVLAWVLRHFVGGTPIMTLQWYTINQKSGGRKDE